MISGPNPTVNPPRLVWNGINVPSHTSQVWIFQAAVPASVPDGTYYNQLDGSTALGPFQGTGPAAPVNVATPVYDLQVSKSDGRITNTIPGRAVYTLLYTSTANALGLVAQNVVLTDTFDPADYLNADAPGWNLVSAGVYTKLIGDLNPGATGLVTIALDISAAIPQQYRGVTNTVQIGAPGALGVPEAVEQNTSNNAARDIDTIRGADLAVVGLSYSPSSLRQGGPLTVAVTFLNQGVDPTLGPDGLGWFGADVYVKPVGDPPPTGPADRYLGACPTVTNFCPATIRWGLFRIVKSYQGPGLAPGETYVMTFNYVLPSGGAQWLYAQADTYWGDPSAGTLYGTPANGRIVEADEANNIYGPLAIYAQGSVYLPLIRKNR
jgi:hypothetical protein